MSQPEGFQSHNKSLVCRLHKALYGLKQAPRAWFEKLASTLISFGFKSSKCDPSLFVHNVDHGCTYILIYVDDILITGASASFIQQLKIKLNSVFALKDLGQLNYFLGIQVRYFSNGSMHLSQEKYIKDLLIKSKMDGAKHINTPMVSSLKLSKKGDDLFNDP